MEMETSKDVQISVQSPLVSTTVKGDGDNGQLRRSLLIERRVSVPAP